jgi:hypothetical protein
LDSLAERRRGRRRQHRINQFFVDLIAYARRHGSAELHRWWHRVDACRWLAGLGASDPWCDGRAIWIEDAVPVRFLLHWTLGTVGSFDVEPHRNLRGIVTQYAATDPGEALLIVTADSDGERAVHEHAVSAGVAAPVATSTAALLSGCVDAAAGQVWAASGEAVTAGARCRLAALNRPSNSTSPAAGPGARRHAH